MQPADPARASRAGKPCPGGKVGAGADRGDALILGAIIAGGKASRFGSDKALALLDGLPLIDHVAASIRRSIDALIVCGRQYRDWESRLDLPHPGLGPLGGILAALDHGATIGADRVLTISCDMPGVAPETLEMLIGDAPAFYAEAPILGCWVPSQRASLADLLEHCEGRGPSVRRWATMSGAVAIVGAPLPNVNTPADLAAL